MLRICFYILIAVLTLSSCSSSRLIIPLAENQKVLSFSAGGPIVKRENFTAPIPLTSVSYGQGIKKNLSWISSIHLTSLSYGVMHFETGLLSNLYYHDKSKLGISYSPVVHFTMDFYESNTKLYPQLDLNLYYYLIGSGGRDCNCPGSGSVKKPILLYAGLTNWFELSSTRTFGLDQPKQFFMNPHFGVMLKGKGWRFQLEGKYLMPSMDNTRLVIDYASFNNQGAIGGFVSYYKTIGRAR